VQRTSAVDNSGLPQALLASTPRRVRVNEAGAALVVTAVVLVAAGIWGGIVLGRRAEVAERHVGRFASERIVTAGDIVRLRKRGGDDDYRTTAHYRYLARGREFTGETRLRREERDAYSVGSTVGVWYLASEPEASWLNGYAPRPQPGWPATAVPLACGLSALVLIQLVRRQSNLLVHGRPAMARVTKVEKKRTDKGTFWMVHFEWTTMSGATRRGKYQHGKKSVPAVGDTIPIVYDRDDTFRHSKYPMSFVTLREDRK
jgi:hypothetical protein